MKTRILKRLSRTTALLLCVLLAAGVFACNNRQTAALFINVPEAVQQAECGVYTVPDFEVVDANGEIHSEYSVTLKSAKDPDGGAVTLLQDGKAINADKIGTYSLTFTASGVADAVLKVAFTKAPPTVVLDEETEIPEYYFKGVRYPIPQFSYGGGADLSKSNLKLYHVAPDSANREEIDLSGGGFTAAFATGSYVIVIHAEGSFGNAKDYEYTVLAADGPSEIVQGKIGYFDEEFGLKQATGLRGNEANITTEYVTDTRYKDEAGSLKVTFTEWDDRNLLQLGNLLESDISDYEYLVYRVYNPNEFRLMAGWGWFGDTSCPAGRWTTVSVPVSSINGDNYAGIPTASSSDVTGLCIRVAGHDVVAGVVPLPADTSFYISALYAIPYPAATPPTEGERVSGKIGYFDTEYGLQQIEAETGKFDNIETEYVTDKYYGAEAGSIKVTFTFWDADNLLRLRNLFETDVSDYDYLVYRVYNPNDFDMMAGYAWFGDTTCKQNAWTAISVDLLNGLPNSGRTTADITGLGIRVAGAGGTAVPAGTSFYISALYAGKISSATAPTAESGKIGYFDTEFGENQVLARPGGFDNITAEYSAVVKYGAEAGSLKVTFTTWDADYNLLRLRNLLESDVSGYDYLIYRVYNPNAYAFTASYAWFGDTNCAANSWTEVCVTTAAVNGAENATAANVTGLGIRVFGGGVTDGTVFYISAMYAVHKPSDIVSGKIGYFDTEFGVHQVTAKDYAGSTPPVEYSTAYKYGTEDGSLKVTYWTTDQGLVLRNLFETDVSGYDYLVYRVYNP
ncbi:MAG: hypothetical protein LBS99_07990, partial [Clostridiales bacterium]|nr:hypothetical protein [Clostridiales bacterium]